MVDGPGLIAVEGVAAAARFGSEEAVRDPAVEGSAVSKEAVVGHIEEQADQAVAPGLNCGPMMKP